MMGGGSLALTPLLPPAGDPASLDLEQGGVMDVNRRGAERCVDLLMAAAFALVVCGCKEASEATQRLGEKAGSEIRGPQVVFDEEIAIDSGGWQSRGFTIPSPRPVQLTVEGRKYTDKGFSIYLMTSDQLNSFRGKKPFRHHPSYHGLKVRSLTKTDTLPAGSWTLVVVNSENLIRGMIVHIKAVTDPQ